METQRPSPSASARATLIPLPSRYAAPPGLPAQLTSFVGRADEIAAVSRLLGAARLVTLTGPPGTGKTRLGLEVAARVADAFPGGIVFVPLASIGDSDLVLPALAQAMGVREPDRARLPLSLAAALRDHRTLLVLDNFEHLAEAGPRIAELLAAAPGPTALVTSRARLNLRGERVVAVPPLALPPVDGRSPDRIGDAEAVALFVDRAQSASSAFGFTPENADAVAEICRRLDGLPLAIELAAARVAVLPPAALLARLDERLPLLTNGPYDLPVRQRTLRGAIGWSHDLLDDDERALFRRLSVFVGSWTTGAAEAVCGSDPIARDRVFDLVASLVDKSLVVADATGEHYRLLETVREYARERLVASGEAAATFDRHAEHFRISTIRDARELPGAAMGDPARFRRIAREYDDLRLALRWLIDRGDATAALQLATSLNGFWMTHGPLWEGRAWLAEALAVPTAIRTAERSDALAVMGSLSRRQTDYAAAAAQFEESLAIAQQLGDARRAVWLLLHLANLAFIRADFPAAAVWLDEAEAANRHIGDPAWQRVTLELRGQVALLTGDLAGARHSYERALERDLGLKDAVPANGLAAVALEEGHPEEAHAHARRALAIERAHGDLVYHAQSVELLAAVATASGQPELAVRAVAAVRAHRTRIGAPHGPAWLSYFDRWLDRARAELGPERFAAAWKGGASMTVEQAEAEVVDGRSQAPRETVARRLDRNGRLVDLASSETVDSTGCQSDLPLTPREREVAALIARGLTDRQIAAELVIAEGTAGIHVQHILGKLGFRSRARVAAWAVEQGLTANRKT